MIKHKSFFSIRIITRVVTVASVCAWYFVPLFIMGKRKRNIVKIANAANRTFHVLGSTFLKFGQLIASSPGLVGVEVADIFRSCLDTGPSMNEKLLIRAIERAAGCPIDDAYKVIEMEPIGSASIAVVHCATTLTNDRVAIKVRRPGVAQRVEDDIRILKGAMRIAMIFGKSADAVQLMDLIEDFERNIQDELDLSMERGAIERVGGQLAAHGFSKIAVPKTFPMLSDDTVLVMEMFDGVAIDNLPGIIALGIDARPLVDDIIRTWLVTSIVDGEFHGDCHAGNVLILRDGRLGLIDWGIVGKSDETSKNFMIRLLEGSVGEESAWREVADFFYIQYGEELLKVFGDTVEESSSKLRDLLSPLLTAPFGQNSLATFLEQSSLQNVDSASSSSVKKSEENSGVSSTFDQGFFLWIKQLVFFERYARLHKCYRSIASYASEVLPHIPESRLYGLDILPTASVVIDGLHHVGHLVYDLESGLALYRRLGFTMTTPRVPAMSLEKAAPLSPFGIANCHADFEEHSFVELFTVVDYAGKLPSGTTLVALKVPAKVLPRFLEIINRTIAKLKACHTRFEGLHILVFRAADVYAQAMRLSQEGIGHSGVSSTQRQSDEQNESLGGVVRFLEIDDPNSPVPEGRLAIAGTPIISNTHPNGSLGLIESILCVAEADLCEFSLRYEKYLNIHARVEVNMSVFELGGSRIFIVTDSALETILPGE